MAPRWKAFTVWLVIPYLSYVAIEVGVPLFRHDVPVAPVFYWRHLAILLRTCAVPAALGTIVLWALPIQRAWLGLMAGALAAIGIIAVYAWFAMTFFGGFEENIDIMIGALILSPPSCLAGAYAGFLRARDQKPTHSG